MRAEHATPQAPLSPALTGAECPQFDCADSKSAVAEVETMWPQVVAVGDTVVFRARRYHVVRCTPRRVAADDPAIFGSHLDGAEGALGSLVGLARFPDRDRRIEE